MHSLRKTERKVRTPQSRIPRASEGRASKLGRQVSQKTNRPRKRVRVKRRGKSSPHEQRCSRQDKPNPVQDEIGSRVARPKTSGSSHPQGHDALRFFAMRREINECNLFKGTESGLPTVNIFLISTETLSTVERTAQRAHRYRRALCLYCKEKTYRNLYKSLKNSKQMTLKIRKNYNETVKQRMTLKFQTKKTPVNPVGV